jgi:hypothetical protein
LKLSLTGHIWSIPCLLSALLTLSCARTTTQQPVANPVDHEAENRCAWTAGSAKPFILGWAPEESLFLKKKAVEGVLLVKYTPCGIEVLPGCGVDGSYDIYETVLAKSTEYIQSSDELFTKLPLGAPDLAEQFEPGESWALSYVLAGLWETTLPAVSRENLTPTCAEATHYVHTIVTGAYEISRDELGQSGTPGASPAPIRQEGDVDRCSRMRSSAIDPLCGAVVQLYLEPLSGDRIAPAADEGGAAPVIGAKDTESGPSPAAPTPPTIGMGIGIAPALELFDNPYPDLAVAEPAAPAAEPAPKVKAGEGSSTIAVSQLMMKDADADVGPDHTLAPEPDFSRGKWGKASAGERASDERNLDVLEYLVEQQRRIKTCYEMGLMVDPTIEGKVKVRFTVLRSGRVKDAEVLLNELPPVVGKCILHKIEKFEFPVQDDARKTYEYPFFFGL